MIVLLDTSHTTCRLTLVSPDGERLGYEWQADRQLAKGLHGFIYEKLQANGSDWQSITGIGAFRGPGSYTGLRIGLTVVNTLASGLGVPIVGVKGDDWHDKALERLAGGEDDRIVLPEYGGEANITKPRK